MSQSLCKIENPEYLLFCYNYFFLEILLPTTKNPFDLGLFSSDPITALTPKNKRFTTRNLFFCYIGHLISTG